MKNFKNLVFAAFAAAGLLCNFSCTKENGCQESRVTGEAYGLISVNLAPEGSTVTKTGLQTADERQINDARLLFFSDDRMVACKSVEGSALSDFPLPAGSYTVWAVANSASVDLSGISSMDALKNVSLGSIEAVNSPGSGFVMAGFNTLSVIAGKTDNSSDISVRRFVSRIHVKSITNNLPEAYDELRVDYFLLCNVPASQNIGGSLAAELWYNPYGRSGVCSSSASALGTALTSGADAMAPGLTWWENTGISVANGRTITPAEHYFYTYPNENEGNIYDTGKATAFSVEKSQTFLWMMTNCGAYRLPLGVLDRNTAYDVDITVNFPGVDSITDDTPEKGLASVGISLADWTPGTGISVEY